MDRNVISVNTTEDQEEAVNLFLKYDLTVLPVVDNDNRLVGIVTVDDALDVLQEETTEDIEKMAAITPTYKPYLKNSVLEIWKSRTPWLLFLMISATFTGMIITHFEDALKVYVVLTAYIPMLMDTGGKLREPGICHHHKGAVPERTGLYGYISCSVERDPCCRFVRDLVGSG